MTILLVVVALVIITAVSVFAVGDGGRMRDDEPDREPADMPADRAVESADLDRLRFAIGVRGYRMDQVDAVLDRMSDDLSKRSEREAQLVAQIRDLGHEPVEAATAPAEVVEPAEVETPSAADESGVAAVAQAPDADEHG